MIEDVAVSYIMVVGSHQKYMLIAIHHMLSGILSWYCSELKKEITDKKFERKKYITIFSMSTYESERQK